MKKFLGILLILFFLVQQSYSAEQNVADIKNNLNIKLMESPKIKNSVKINNKNFELNEKVLNMSILPSLKPSLVPEGIIYREEYRSVNAINPKKQGNINANYPGLRGPNQLIIYTPAFGSRTGTNEFGTEAIVENNMVVRMNGADSIIPANGFVISGHGNAKKWIIKNLQVGSKVYIDYTTNSIKVFLTPESLIFAAKEKLREVNGVVDYYKYIDNSYNYKKAAEYLNSSKNALKKAENKPEKTQTFITEAMKDIDEAMKNALPYYEDELKGVWIRPVEKSPEEIIKTIERISNAGITDIFLETYFHGKTIYPSRYLKENGITSQREEFIGFDPLDVWIKEAHKRKMKVHIWFETFYVGNDNPKTNPTHVLNVHPTWANKRLLNYDSADPVPSLSEHNGYFLDPANTQVQVYLKSILKEIINKYKPDGINLDYIRYPQTVDPSYSNYALTNWGYTEFARNEFIFLYGIDPIEIKYGTGDWELWALYRQRKISDFVSSVRKMTKDYNITLTAVIFPDLKKCRSMKMQDWKDWSYNDYVDGFTPLILTGDKNTAELLLKDIIQNTTSYTNIYPGLFVTFMGGPFDELLLQLQKTREYKTKGAVLFDYAHLNDTYINALTTRVFNKTYTDKDNKKSDGIYINSDSKKKNKKKSKGN